VDESINKKSAGKIFNNPTALEEYLMALEEPVSAQEVYKETWKLLQLTEEDIQNETFVRVSYVDVQDEKETVRGIVDQSWGVMQEYGVLENGETFVVCRDGNWRYVNDSAKIYFFAKTQSYRVDWKEAKADESMQSQISKTVEHAKKRISQMWDFVK